MALPANSTCFTITINRLIPNHSYFGLPFWSLHYFPSSIEPIFRIKQQFLLNVMTLCLLWDDDAIPICPKLMNYSWIHTLLVVISRNWSSSSLLTHKRINIKICIPYIHSQLFSKYKRMLELPSLLKTCWDAALFSTQSCCSTLSATKQYEKNMQMFI